MIKKLRLQSMLLLVFFFGGGDITILIPMFFVNYFYWAPNTFNFYKYNRYTNLTDTQI